MPKVSLEAIFKTASLDTLLQGDNYRANSSVGIAARLLAAIIVALENDSYIPPSGQSQ